MKLIGMATLGLMVAATTSIPALSSELDKSILGTWRGPLVKSCKAISDMTTDDYMTIGLRKIDRHESSCQITKSSKSKEGFIIQSLCEAEGETFRDTLRIKMISRNRILVNGNKAYERCN